VPRRSNTTPRRAPRQKRSEDTVQVLLKATEIVVSRDGYAGATTNHIAEAAGVSIGTLYHFFPSKEALIEALVHKMWEDELAALEAHKAVLESVPLREAVPSVVTAFVEQIRKREAMYRRLYGEASHLGQLDVGLELADRATAMITEVLERRRDEVRPKNIRFAVDLMVKTVASDVRTATHDWPKELASGELTQELIAMVSRYLLV
jgi:AcrR family transcriptional regulator